MLTPPQRLAHARESLALALDHVREAILDLEAGEAGAWVGSSEELKHQRRQMIFLAHRVYGLLHGGRLPPLRADVALALRERHQAQHQGEHQDEQEEIPGCQGGASKGSR